LIGKDLAIEMEAMAIKIYTLARDFAETKGVIIADTKFEFGVDENGKLILADEVLTPDSSRFWPLESYVPGKSQPRYCFLFS
jgi:phosphoribosylaminoimidazole-succinocarboxamide synthase